MYIIKYTCVVQLCFHIKLVDSILIGTVVARIKSIGHVSVGIVLMIGIHQLIVRIIIVGAICRLISCEATCEAVAVVVLIVERYHGLGRETLGEPVHLIVNDEVGLIDSVVTLIVTTIRQATYDVILILCITTPQCLGGLTIWNLIRYRVNPAWFVVQLIECLTIGIALV